MLQRVRIATGGEREAEKKTSKSARMIRYKAPRKTVAETPPPPTLPFPGSYSVAKTHHAGSVYTNNGHRLTRYKSLPPPREFSFERGIKLA